MSDVVLIVPKIDTYYYMCLYAQNMFDKRINTVMSLLIK